MLESPPFLPHRRGLQGNCGAGRRKHPASGQALLLALGDDTWVSRAPEWAGDSEEIWQVLAEAERGGPVARMTLNQSLATPHLLSYSQRRNTTKWERKVVVWSQVGGLHLKPMENKGTTGMKFKRISRKETNNNGDSKVLVDSCVYFLMLFRTASHCDQARNCSSIASYFQYARPLAAKV